MGDRILPPREWLCNGGGGHEDGEDGIRAMRVTGEGLIDFLQDYGEYIADNVLEGVLGEEYEERRG